MEGLNPYSPERHPASPASHPLEKGEKTRETAEEVLQVLRGLNGFSEYTEQNALLKELPSSELVVRREDPKNLLSLLETGEPLEIRFVGNTPYANSVEWNPSLDGSKGLDNAYLEGFSHKDNVVMVYGFKKPKGFFFKKLDDSQQSFAGVDRTRVRSAAGYVPVDAVSFISVRIPIVSFPEEEMTEKEKDELFDRNEGRKSKKPPYVYRCFIKKEDRAS